MWLEAHDANQSASDHLGSNPTNEERLDCFEQTIWKCASPTKFKATACDIISNLSITFYHWGS